MGGDKIILLDGMGTNTAAAGYDAGMMSMLPSLFASAFAGSKTDPALIQALMNGNNNRNSWGGDGCWWIWIILLFWMWGGNGSGLGGRGGMMPAGLPEQLNNATGRELLSQAIQGNREAIAQLASGLNCDVTALQGSINGITNTLANIAGQVGMSQQAVINSVQSQGCEIGNKISTCCCNLQSLINQSAANLQTQFNAQANALGSNLDKSVCGINNNITQQGFNNQLRTVEQTNALQNAFNSGMLNLNERMTGQFNILSSKIDAQTTMINQQFCDLEKRTMQQTIDSLREEKNALQSSALLQQQSRYIIDTVRPCPIPCYQACNPWGCNAGAAAAAANAQCGGTCCGNA